MLIALGLVATACASSTPQDSAPAAAGSTAPPTTEPTPTLGSSGDRVPSALRDGYEDPSFPQALVDTSQIISGGPPPDGIPPIDTPQFVTVGEAAEWLKPAEPVVYVDLGGEVRAYPVQILIWHEIVNDVVGGVPITVTYCPLCNSAVSYDRTVNGEVTTFGTSGRLFNSALVMYDRATESLWTHYDGRAVVGHLTGTTLAPIPSPLIAWSDFAEQFPDALVLDRATTGHARAYGSNPYGGYDDESATPFLFRGDADDRAALMRRVVGVVVGDDATAWALDALASGEANATAGTVGDTGLVIFWKAGQSSALDANRIGDGRDVGSVGVFVPVVDGRALTFTAVGDRFEDLETGSSWSITGRALSGDLEGSQLEQIHHLDTFWFAWSSYRPGTALIGG